MLNTTLNHHQNDPFNFQMHGYLLLNLLVQWFGMFGGISVPETNLKTCKPDKKCKCYSNF